MISLSSIWQDVMLLLILSALVVAHEWGHFIVARLFRIRVDDFSIGFGRRLVRLGKLGDTEYNIRVLPLGGFVKIAGMEADEEPIVRVKDAIRKNAGGEDQDSAELPLVAENTGEASVYDGPDGFNAKPLWQRSLVIFAGPLMSFITGVAILCLLGCTLGIPAGKPLNRVAVVEPDGEGHRIGLRAGDQIIAINGVPTPTGWTMIDKLHNSLGETLVLTIERDGKTLVLPPARPRQEYDDVTHKAIMSFIVTNPGQLSILRAGDTVADINNDDVTSASQFARDLAAAKGRAVTIDVMRDDQPATLKGALPAAGLSVLPTIVARPVAILNFQPQFQVEHLRFVESCKQGFETTADLFESIGLMAKAHQLQNSAGSIIRMADVTGIAMKDGPSYVLRIAAQISISLGIMNLLPIPILDGGHLLAFFIEWVRKGKKMSPQVQQAFLLTGLAIIAVLFCLVTGHDIMQKITHHVEQ